jgi:hypothetical protein
MRSLEGWVRRVGEDGLLGGLREGMVSRKVVEGEMERRGLRMGNGREEEVLDEEEMMARMMDERMAEREAQGMGQVEEDRV